MGVASDIAVAQALADYIEMSLGASDPVVHVEALGFLSAETPSIDFVPTSPNALIESPAGYGQIRGPFQVHMRVRVSPADLEAGQEILWELCDDVGSLSLLAILNSAIADGLGGLIDTIAWGDWGELLEFPHPQGDGVLMGRMLPLEIVKAFS